MITVFEEETVTVFVDTNIFIQMKDIQDLPWKNIFPNLKELRVMVCLRIIEELDSFKNSPIQRRRKRSRAALKTIKLAARATGRQIILRDTPFKIIFKLNDSQNLNWEAYERLDASRPDDHLVLETLSHKSNAIVFSHDTGPYVQALAHGVEAAEPQDEGWLLPYEPTGEELKIRRLERELEQTKANNPQVTVSFKTENEPIESVILLIPILPPLETNLVEKLTSAYLELNPPYDIVVPQYSGLLGMSAFGDKLTQSDKDEYLKKYALFKKETHKFFQTLHEEVERVSLAQPIAYQVENVGQIAAKGLRVDARIAEPFYLLADEDDAVDNVGGLSFPAPPKEPVPRVYRHVDNLHRHAFLQNHKKPRDPVKFYWEIRPKYGSLNSALQCEDFRATEAFMDSVWICALHNQAVTGQLKLKVSASNLRQPKSATITFSFIEKEMSWTDTRFHDRLPEPLSEVLLSQLT